MPRCGTDRLLIILLICPVKLDNFLDEFWSNFFLREGTDCFDSQAGRARHVGKRHVRQLGISEKTFYRWKKQYAGMQVEGVRELKILQEENARLKKLVAELSLDKAILQDVASKKWNGPR